MDSPLFLSIQASYTKLQLALYKGDRCLEVIDENSRKASSTLIPLIKSLLEKHALSFDAVSFIALDQGPGAFTSLRVSVATVNGLGFAGNIPLIGIDGLHALAVQMKSDCTVTYDVIVPLLNAYNNEVYYAFYDGNMQLVEDTQAGYQNIESLLGEIQERFAGKKVLFGGNGALMHRELLEKSGAKNCMIPSFESCSVQQVAALALVRWHAQENIQKKVYPLYLKSQKFAIRSMPNRSNRS